MKLSIRHLTHYQYTSPVYLETQHLYFYPSLRTHFKIADFHIISHPKETGMGLRLDGENNMYYQCWFTDHTESFSIEVAMKIEVTPFNPFNFLIENEITSGQQLILDQYRQGIALSQELINWVDQQKNLCPQDSLNLLIFLNREINQNWDHEIRYESNLLTPDECFHTRSGSCRDLSWMLMNMVRYLNFPARFVSGYAFNPELGDGHELHAWIETWLPGAGWIGLDPSAGLLTDEKYIPVATSYHPSNTFPVQGTFRGNAEANLSFDVQIAEIS